MKKEHSEAQDLEGAAVIIENQSGRIILTVGSRDFFGSEYDRSLDMKRPPGSAFFPFVYAAAFEEDEFDASSIVIDAPFDNREMGLGGITGVLGEWSTENPKNRWEGRITAGEALRLSKNSPTARLGLQVGLGQVSGLAASLGVESEIRPLSGSLLGASEMNLRELTRAYTVFPNRGAPSPKAHLIESVFSGDKEIEIGLEKEVVERVLSTETAEVVASLIGGKKSGTTSAYTDAWHFGFNEDYTWGVWIGKDAFETIFPMAFGSKLASPVANAIIETSALGTTEASGVVSMKSRKSKLRPDEMRRQPTVVPTTPALIGPDTYATLGMK